MEKVKFETKQDYLDYIKINRLNSVYNLQYVNFGEPLSYPCILVWYEDCNQHGSDEIYGEYVYRNEFD